MVDLENPHGWLYIDAKDSQGKIVNWALELPGPALLRRNGFDQGIYETMRTSGEVVTVTAYAAKDGSKHAIGESLTRADGKTVIPLQRGGYRAGSAAAKGRVRQGSPNHSSSKDNCEPGSRYRRFALPQIGLKQLSRHILNLQSEMSEPRWAIGVRWRQLQKSIAARLDLALVTP